MAQDISIVRGTTNAFGITVMNADGEPITLENGQVLVWGLKRKPKDDERVLVKQITHYIDGIYYLEIEPADTLELECGKYYYDVGLQHGDGVFYNVIEASVFEIKPNITKLGDGA